MMSPEERRRISLQPLTGVSVEPADDPETDVPRGSSSVSGASFPRRRPSLDELSCPINLSLRDVTYTIKPGKRDMKRVICGVDADFRAGKVSAVMGPSGAGKTTIFNILTLNAKWEIGGEVLANGSPIDAKFKLMSNLVPQEDILLPALKVWETMMYAAELRLPRRLSKANRVARVEAVLVTLGIMECAETRVGNCENRGISGGQRKRLSIGLELLTQPAVLLLDEPTSGLDSKAAEDVCSVLQNLASLGRTVLCTIHQPSWKMFCKFDDLLMLSSGCVVYRGQASMLPQHFAELGHPSPQNENPVDHVMRVLQEGEVDHFANQFGRLHAAPITTLPYIPRGTAFYQQLSVIFRRACYDSVVDTSKFVTMCSTKLAISIIIGTCWWQAASPARAEKAFSITGVMFMFTMNSLMDNLFDTVMKFPMNKLMFLREYKNGSYSTIAWFIAYVCQAIVFTVPAVVLLTVPAYFMIGLRVDTFPVAFLCILLASSIGVLLGTLMGVISKDVQQASSSLLPVIVPLLLFSGYIIPKDDIPEFFRWVYYIDIFQFTFTILRVNQFDGLTFVNCPGPKDKHFTNFCLCFEEDPPPCKGSDFLEKNGLAGASIADNFLYLIAVFVFLLFPAYAAVYWKANAKTG